jgi:hypothetical protein
MGNGDWRLEIGEIERFDRSVRRHFERREKSFWGAKANSEFENWSIIGAENFL